MCADLEPRIDQPVVGLNIDNVPLLNKDNFDFDMADIERIEILRGPQNILYGRNTMGGLINIHTSFPRLLSKVSEFWRICLAQQLQRLARPLQAPLTPHRNVAQCLRHRHRRLFQEMNTTTRMWAANAVERRWKTIYRAGDSFIIENTASLSHSLQNGYPYKSVKTSQIAYNDTCFYKRLTVTDGLTLNGRTGNVNLSGIASFQYINDNMTLDQDFLPLDYFTLTQKRHEWAFTADFVAKSNPCKHYRWLVGAFGYLRRSHMSAPVTFFDYGLTHLIEENANKINPQYPLRWDNRELYLGSDFTMPSAGGSFYHESTASLGRFTASLGLRWDWNVPKYNITATPSPHTQYTISPTRGKRSTLPR